MPITANAKKALRQQRSRGTRNKAIRATVRTAIKKNAKQADGNMLAQLFSVVDKAVKKHLIHKNKAARIKSQAVKSVTAPVEKPKAVKSTKSIKTVAKKTVKKTKKTTK